MKRLLRGIRRKTVDALGLDRMSEKYHVLVLNYLFLLVYTTLESVFVNTLLFSLHGSIAIVVYYRGITYFTTAMSMNLAAYLGQRKTPLLVIRMGAGLYICQYVILFAALEQMDKFAIVAAVALFSGFGSGFYWSGHNSLVPDYTTPQNRDVGIGVMGIVQGGMTLLAPIVSGYVIYLMPGTTGYRVMFGIGMAAALAQLKVQSRLSPVERKRHVSQVALAVKAIRRKVSVQLMLGMELVRGVREGTMVFLLNMLIFELVTDESLVGVNSFVSGGAAVLASWIYGRFMQPRFRSRVVFGGAAILTLTGLTLGISMQVATLILFSVINSFLQLFLAHSGSNTVFDVVTQNETLRSCMGELIAFREVALMLGRLLGLAIFMSFPHDLAGYVVAIFVLNASQFLYGVLMEIIRRVQARKALTAESSGGDAP